MSDATWPLPGYHFAVQFGSGITGTFQMVGGLEQTSAPIEYRGGGAFAPIKMPDLGKVGTVKMHKGIFAADSKTWAWFTDIKMNTLQPGTIVIDLIDPAGATTYTWTLTGAWPIKFTGTDLKPDLDERIVDFLQVEYATITQSAA
jgi:phage tail-like protein